MNNMETVASDFNKRARKLKWGKRNYRDFFKINLEDLKKCSRASRRKTAASRDKLYSIEVVQTDGDKVKVHYIGYSDIYDEWKDKNEIEYFTPANSSATAGTDTGF